MRLDDLRLWYLGDPAAPRPVGAVIAVVNTWQEHFARAAVTPRDVASLALRIDGEALLSQRLGFDPARFQAAPTRHRRASPFRRD
jgi:serine/threonine-protein kinase HipA